MISTAMVARTFDSFGAPPEEVPAALLFILLALGAAAAIFTLLRRSEPKTRENAALIKSG
jgi:hypothetical protein